MCLVYWRCRGMKLVIWNRQTPAGMTLLISVINLGQRLTIIENSASIEQQSPCMRLPLNKFSKACATVAIVSTLPPNQSTTASVFTSGCFCSSQKAGWTLLSLAVRTMKGSWNCCENLRRMLCYLLKHWGLLYSGFLVIEGSIQQRQDEEKESYSRASFRRDIFEWRIEACQGMRGMCEDCWQGWQLLSFRDWRKVSTILLLGSSMSQLSDLSTKTVLVLLRFQLTLFMSSKSPKIIIFSSVSISTSK